MHPPAPHASTTLDAIKERSLLPDRFTLIALATRPGIHRFFMTLEYEYFPPGTPVNDEMDYFVVLWEEEPWTIVVIPFWARELAHRVATETGMRIADGVPLLCHRGTWTYFPIRHERAYTMENDKGSPLYFPGGDDFIREEERRWITAFWRKRGRDEHGNPV